MSDASSSELGKQQRDELDLRGIFGNQRDQALSIPIFLPSVVSYRWHEEASHHHADGSCTSRSQKRSRSPSQVCFSFQIAIPASKACSS
jgi:hypothetical protein